MNCRPISLLCVTSKVLECCVFHHAIKHCFKFLHDSQHGFFKGRSDTVAQLLGFLCKIKTTIIYLNFTKAFDRVSHPHLIQKLHHNHILGPLLFLMYIDELPPVIDCDSFIGMFADDSKCYRTILNSLDCTNLQNDLDVASELAKTTLFKVLKHFKMRTTLYYTQTEPYLA